MPSYWPSRFVLRYMSEVRKPWDTNMVLLYKPGVLSVHCWQILLWISLVWCVYYWKNSTVLFVCIQKRVKSIVFAVSIKFCDESGLAILIQFCDVCNYSTSIFHSATEKSRMSIVFIKDSLTNDKELNIFLKLNLQNKQSIMTRASYPQILSDSEKVQSTSQTN